MTIVADFSTGFVCCYCSARFRSSAEHVIPEQFSDDPRLERRLLCWGCASNSLAAEKIGAPPSGRPRWAGRGLQVLDRSRVARVSTGTRADKIYRPGEAEGSAAWVWTYLGACLATCLGYDEARQVVEVVRYGGSCS